MKEKIQDLKYLRNVATLELNIDKCTGCGLCTTVCPHAVFEVAHKKAAIVNINACMECGACARNCPVEAIKVRSGVGCASGIIQGALKGTEPSCGGCCGSDKSCCG